MTEEIAPFAEFLSGYRHVHELDDGTYVAIWPLMFTHAIIRGEIGNMVEIQDRWCYKTEEAAMAALAVWLVTGCRGEPEGWHRHPASGRRRPDGDSSREYVAE